MTNKNEASVTQLPQPELSELEQFKKSLPKLMPDGYVFDSRQNRIIHQEWKRDKDGNDYSIDTIICSPPLAVTALTHSEDEKEGRIKNTMGRP